MNKIVIIGGGNIGTHLAATIARTNKFKVVVLTESPNKWGKIIDVYNNQEDIIYSVENIEITSSVSGAFKDANIILSTLPSNIYHKKIKTYIERVPAGTYFGTIPGLGGKEFPVLNNPNFKGTYFSVQRVLGVARLREYGNSVYELGNRNKMYYFCVEKDKSSYLESLLEEMMGVEFQMLDNLLNITLTPSNPILHTARLYNLYFEGDNGVFKNRVKFYDSWDNSSSKLLIEMDQELELIKEKLQPIDLSFNKSLLEHYDSNNYEELTSKIRSIDSFKNIESPLKKTAQGYVFDTESRYFTEDFDYGLLILKGISEILGIATPNIDKVLKWYEKISGKEFLVNEKLEGRSIKGLPLPSHYGLDTKDKIIKYYTMQD